MFRRLFGETDEMQFQYLHKKAMLTLVGAALCLIGLLLALIRLRSIASVPLGIGAMDLAVALFMWGFGAIRSLLGFGTIGALFSGNVVFGVVIFVFCAMAAYLVSIIIAFLGVGRYIYLRVKLSQERR